MLRMGSVGQNCEEKKPRDKFLNSYLVLSNIMLAIYQMYNL